MVMGISKGDPGGVTDVKNSDSPKGVVKSIRTLCLLMERCDSHGEGVGSAGRCEYVEESFGNDNSY